MFSPLGRNCTAMIKALLLLAAIASLLTAPTTTAQFVLENGNVFEKIKYAVQTSFDSNANLKDEKAYSSTITWKSCSVFKEVLVIGTFDLNKDFLTSLYFMLEKTRFVDDGHFDFVDLPPNSYVHAVQTTASNSRETIYNIRTYTNTNNITTFFDDSDIANKASVGPFANIFVPLGSPYIVAHIINAKLKNLAAILYMTTCSDGSVIFVKKVTCTNCIGDIAGLYSVKAISRQSAFIMEEITIVNHAAPASRWLVGTDNIVDVDATSVFALIDIDVTNGFTAARPVLRLFSLTRLTGTGTVVLLRIKMGSSGLKKILPDNNENFWVAAQQSASTYMNTTELRAAFFNVNTNNVINWDGTGADGKCVQAGLALPNTATYEMVNGKCEATCPQGNYLPPACTPRAVCFGVPNCKACFAHPKDKCLECLPHTTPENGTLCRCPISDCIECPSATLCTNCTKGYTYFSKENACIHCDVDKCALCKEVDKCSSCEPGYTLYENQCTKISFTCNIPNCASCLSPSTCIACNTEFKPTSDATSCFHCTTPSCKECSSDDVCGACNDGYSLVEASSTPTDNKCVHCDIANCQACKEDGICSTCADGGYKLSPDGLRCTLCDVDGCQRCDLSNICALCGEGMTANDDGQCVPCAVEGCQYCSKNNVCAACTCDQVPSDDGKSCVPCDLSSCSHCDPLGGGATCAECADGYKVSGSGVCTKTGMPQWGIFLVVFAVTMVLLAAFVVGYIQYQRRLTRLADMATDAEVRRRNRTCQSGSIRSHLRIAILDLGDIEGAASGVRDVQKSQVVYEDELIC